MSNVEMTFEQASAIVGDQQRLFVKNMNRALGYMAYSNTPEEQRRHKASGMVLRNWVKHSALRQAARDARFARKAG